MLGSHRRRLIDVDVEISQITEMLFNEWANVLPAESALATPQRRHRKALNSHVLVMFCQVFQRKRDVFKTRILAPVTLGWKIQYLYAVVFPKIRFAWPN